MTSDFKDHVMTFILGIGFGIVLGIAVFGTLLDNKWRKEAVEYGYAQYNSITGEWEWKEPCSTK